jgi:(+)-neomenthol dehydrogenase
MFSISNVLLYWIIDQIIGVNAASQRKLMKQTYEMSISCLRTNYYGIKHLTEALIPILERSNSARIVNVSSSFGKLKVNTPYISISFRH